MLPPFFCPYLEKIRKKTAALKSDMLPVKRTMK